MSDDTDKMMMSHNMINRGPGKRQIKPTAFLLSHFELPDEEEDDDFEFGRGPARAEAKKESDNSENEDSDEDEEESSSGSDEEESSDESDASSSDETALKTENDESSDEVPTELICSVCLNQLESNRHESIIKCDKCGISVHEGCYAGIFLEDDNGSNVESWFCEPCLLGATNVHCELCPDTKGAYKLSEFSGQFVHMVCALFTENVTWADNLNLLGASYQEVKHRLFGYKRCSGCSDEVSGRCGVATRCELGECNKYYHITCAQRLGLLVDRSDSDDGPQTHPRFLACKAHNRNTDAVKAMKEMHSKFVKQENARLKQIKKDDPQVATDLDNMKVKLDEVLQKLQGVSITKPDIHCNSAIRQRYARHVHTCARLLDDFKRKSELFKQNNVETGGDEGNMSAVSSMEDIEEEMDALTKRNRKLASLKKKLEVEREKLTNLHAKKEARIFKNKKERIAKMQEEIPQMTKEAPEIEAEKESSEKAKAELIDILRSCGFPTEALTFSDDEEEPEENDEVQANDNNDKAEKENPKPLRNRLNSTSGSPSPKRKKISDEENQDIILKTEQQAK